MNLKKYIYINTKRGAMFGVDARIALAIFSIVSIVVVASIYRILTEINVDKVLAESTVIGVAVDDFHKDINKSIFNSVDQSLTADNKEKATFMALNKVSTVSSALQAKWNGPYLKLNYLNAVEPFLGTEYRLVKLSKTGAVTCNNLNTNPCYVFLKFKNLQHKICDEFASSSKVIQSRHVASCDILINIAIDY